MHLADLDAEALNRIPIAGIGGSPVGRLGVADDVARVMLFAVSDLAMFRATHLDGPGGIAA